MSEKPFLPDIITDLPGFEHNYNGLESHVMQGEKQQFVFMSFTEDNDVPEHSHAGQWAVVLDGVIELKVDGVVRQYSRGDTYYIPAGTLHSAKIHRGYKDLTFFDQVDRYTVKKSDK